MTTRALILFAHGARAAGWAVPFERLCDQTRERLPDVAVSLAFLELMEPRLPSEVARLAAEGVQDVTIVPVFLGVGDICCATCRHWWRNCTSTIRACV